MKKLLITLCLLANTGFALCAEPVMPYEPKTEAKLEYNQGIDFYKIGQYDRAMASFRQAINIDPNYIDAYYNLGSILEYLKQDEAALAVFKQIIVRKPDDYESVYKAANKVKRIMLQDVYMSLVTDLCGNNIPNPRTFNNVYSFTSKGMDEEEYSKYFACYGNKKMGEKLIADKKFVMCVRSSFKNYLQKLNSIKPLSGSVLIYSMWDGYKNQKTIKAFLDFAQSLGMNIIDIHTSGHADCNDLERFLKKINPQYIIPVHTVNIEWFVEKYGAEKVVRDKIFIV